MQKFFKKLFLDKIILMCFWGTVLFFIAAIAIILINYSHLPPLLPIYNKLSWGYARLGPKYEIFIPLLIPFLLCVNNVVVGKYIYEKAPLLARFLFLTMLLLMIFTFIFILKLTLIIL